MDDDTRKYEPHVRTARFRDFRGEYTPLPYPGMTVTLTKDQQLLVNTIIAMYNGRIAEHRKDFEVLYSEAVIFSDGLSLVESKYCVPPELADTRRC